MFTSRFGAFNGDSWEQLCQQVFKRKYAAEDYQQCNASPGDFGIEGFTLATGLAFQCYCPNKHYCRAELYEKQRDKITHDLGKLKTYQADILKRIGSTKLRKWLFVTPEVDKNALLAHAREKEEEVKAWGLPFIDDNFRVLLHDGDNYLIEINEIRAASGEAIVIPTQDHVASTGPAALTQLTDSGEVYDKNVHRKTRARLRAREGLPGYEDKVARLHKLTLEEFLATDGVLREIEAAQPAVHRRLVLLIQEFEKWVEVRSCTWTGQPEQLTEEVRQGLADRIGKELSQQFNPTYAAKIARHMVARWLAVCELDYD